MLSSLYCVSKSYIEPLSSIVEYALCIKKYILMLYCIAFYYYYSVMYLKEYFVFNARAVLTHYVCRR